MPRARSRARTPSGAPRPKRPTRARWRPRGGRPLPAVELAREVTPAAADDLRPQRPQRPPGHRVVEEHDALTSVQHAAEAFSVVGRGLDELRRIGLSILDALHLVTEDRVELA